MSDLEEEIQMLQAVIDSFGESMNSKGNMNGEEPEQEKAPNAFARNVIEMRQGNILQEAIRASIAHCVGADLLMSDGPAKHIKEHFDVNIEQLRPRSEVGAILEQKNGEHYILHMVTKPKSQEKPNWKKFKRTITNLEAKCSELGIQQLIIPKIGCGLDGLEWSKTMRVLKSVFLSSQVQLTVVYLSDAEENAFRSEVGNRRLRATIHETIPRLEVIGDSQVKNLGSILREKERIKKIYVTSTSGATTQQLCQELNIQTAHLMPEDTIFLLSGTNDIKKKEDGEINLLQHEAAHLDFISQKKHVKVCIISTPHRFDVFG